MRLRLHALEIRVVTENGPFGTTLRFDDGLVVVRGENSSGKSTCLAAILYALGLEGLFLRSQDSPFPESMTQRLEHGNEWLPVLESSVLLEFSGPNDRVLTAKRMVTGELEKRQLVTVLSGAAITGAPGTPLERRDYFVRIPGSAKFESGFHYFLAELLGFDLPLVPRFDGPPVPLYVETLFPFLFVDQLRGWSGLATRMPTHFRIMELWNSALEYLLSLDIQANALQEHQLKVEAERIRVRWRATFEEVQIHARGLGFVAQHVSSEPVMDWPPKPMPALTITEGETWVDLDSALESRRGRLHSLEKEEIPRIEHVANELQGAVYEAERELDRLERAEAELAMEVNEEAGQISAMETRLVALREDRRKYKDEQRLRERGAPGNLKLIRDTCPTCKQALKDTLLSQRVAGEPMSLEDNLRFIEGQLGLFQSLQQESLTVLKAKQQRLHALRQKIADQAAIVRARKRTFRGDAEAPSVAAIRERLLEEDKVERMEHLSARFQATLAAFASLAEEWRVNQGKLHRLLKATLSVKDREKLGFIQDSLVEQLRLYGFKSFEPEQIKISETTYRPTRDDVDLPSAVQMSASDAVRLIWAYLVALLEVARDHKTHHPGILIFDEPQQQHMKEISFGALLKRLAPCRTKQQQVIIATSEPLPSLRSMLDNVPSQIIELPERVLAPLPK